MRAAGATCHPRVTYLPHLCSQSPCRSLLVSPLPCLLLDFPPLTLSVPHSSAAPGLLPHPHPPLKKMRGNPHPCLDWRRVATGQVGAQLKLPVSAVPQGSGQGARGPGSEPQTGAGGPESRGCSAPAGSSGKGAQRLPGGPGHTPTSKDGQGKDRSGETGRGEAEALLLVAHLQSPVLPTPAGPPFKAPFPSPDAPHALGTPAPSPEACRRNDPR